MTVLPPLELIRHDRLDHVVAAVDDQHIPYAGGTELVPAMRLGLRRPTALVDLKRVGELRAITADLAAGQIVLGAAVTHRELTISDVVTQYAPTLAAAAARVGNARVRSTGTIGGNLCFGEPRSDLGTILVALAASCRSRSSSGERTQSIDELLVGAFETSLGPDELLTTVIVPFEPSRMSYWKLQSFERPTVGVALIRTDSTWQITVGAATERPERVEVEAGDVGAVAAFVDGLELSDDLSGSPDYKRSVLRSYLASVLGGDGS